LPAHNRRNIPMVGYPGVTCLFNHYVNLSRPGRIEIF
jgi:hypothetical protein